MTDHSIPTSCISSVYICAETADVCFLFNAFDNENNRRDFSSETNCWAVLFFSCCGRATLKSALSSRCCLLAVTVVVVAVFVRFGFNVEMKE